MLARGMALELVAGWWVLREKETGWVRFNTIVNNEWNESGSGRRRSVGELVGDLDFFFCFFLCVEN